MHWLKSLILISVVSILVATFPIMQGCVGSNDPAFQEDNTDGTPEELSPGLRFQQFDRGEMEFVLSPGAVQQINIREQGNDFTRLAYPNTAFTGETGYPEIPYVHKLFAIPVGAQVHLNIQYGKSHIIEDVLLFPVQPPQPDTRDGLEPFAFDQDAYSNDAFSPSELAYLDHEQVMRGVRFSGLWLTNYRYNPARRQLEVFEEVSVSIEFEGESDNFLKDPCLGAGNFNSIYQSAFVNFSSLSLEKEMDDCGSTRLDAPDSFYGAEFLIITHADFLDAANTLKDWKIKTGLDTEVRTTAQTGNTCAAIQTFVQNAYNGWNPAPQWLLILGDADYVPTCYSPDPHPYSGYGDTCYTAADLYYATVDGTDYVPDISHGRIPIDTLAEANDRINKIIAYENNPPSNDGFYQTTTHAAYFQDKADDDDPADGQAARRFCLTAEESYQYFSNVDTALGYTPQRIYQTEAEITPLTWNQGNYYWFASWWTGTLGLSTLDLAAELLKPGFAWDGDTADISSAINTGTFLLLHRDHGNKNGWAEPAFIKADVDALTNGSLLPVVFSINCETGWFDTETDDSQSCAKTGTTFSERWFNNSNGGAVGVIGATRVSYSGVNDKLIWGWFDALYPGYDPAYPSASASNENPDFRMGDVVNYGKIYLTENYSSNKIQLAYEQFLWFGDPTTRIWTGIPQNLVVTHDATIDAMATSFTVNVDQDDSLVSLTQEGYILGTATSTGGSANVNFTQLISPNDMNVVVTKHNFIPYQGTVSVNGTPPSTTTPPTTTTTTSTTTTTTTTSTTTTTIADCLSQLTDDLVEDDGSFEASLGAATAGYYFSTCITPDHYPSYLTEVLANFGSTAGNPFKFHVFVDPDGNGPPDGAALYSSPELTIATDQWLTHGVAGAAGLENPINSGSWCIAIESLDGNDYLYMDSNNNDGHTWFGAPGSWFNIQFFGNNYNGALRAVSSYCDQWVTTTTTTPPTTTSTQTPTTTSTQAPTTTSTQAPTTTTTQAPTTTSTQAPTTTTTQAPTTTTTQAPTTTTTQAPTTTTTQAPTTTTTQEPTTTTQEPTTTTVEPTTTTLETTTTTVATTSTTTTTIPDNVLFYESADGAALTDNYCDTLVTDDIIDVAENYSILDVDVGILVSHTFRGDLLIELESPDGTVVTLYNDRATEFGDPSDNLYGTFDQESLNMPNSGVDDTNQSYENRDFMPYDSDELVLSLDGFNAEYTQGDWTLSICDRNAGDTGELVSWALWITYDPDVTTTTTTPATTTTTTIPADDDVDDDLNDDIDDDIDDDLNDDLNDDINDDINDDEDVDVTDDDTDDDIAPDSGSGDDDDDDGGGCCG